MNLRTHAIVLEINYRFFNSIKKNIVTAHSLAGAKMFMPDSEQLQAVKDLLDAKKVSYKEKVVKLEI